MAPSVNVARMVYPESDGQPMAENTKQFRYITTIQGGLDALFRDDPRVFVAGDLFWYPVEGHPEISQAPDIFVAFGRPKGDRGSYRQWEEDAIAPQVVFEIRSPSDSAAKMARKRRFYSRYGVREYYVYDPERGTLHGWQGQGQGLEEIAAMAGWISPLLGVRFALVQGELQLSRPDGERFATYLELVEQRMHEQQRAEGERQRAERAQQQAERAQQQAEGERQRAEHEHQRAEHERQRAERERQRADTLAARLRALGLEPDET